jgi:hypothetical protein
VRPGIGGGLTGCTGLASGTFSNRRRGITSRASADSRRASASSMPRQSFDIRNTLPQRGPGQMV